MTKTLGLACALVLAACDGSAAVDGGSVDEDAGADDDAGGRADGGRDGGGGAADSGTAEDAGATGECGTARPALTGITGTEGLIIARDGTIYYSRNGGVGRLTPGGSPENGFVSLPGTIWGLALDASNETLYVGNPGNAVHRVDLTEATPPATPLVTDPGAPNGLTVGPDGFVYYSDFNGRRVYRVDPDGGAPAEVTTSTIAGANGIAFESGGTLLVASYATGQLFRLTLAAGQETGRAVVTDELGSPDGVGVAADGTIYVGDQGGPIQAGVYSISGSVVTPVRTRLSAPASVEFGAGPLRCEDLHVAIGGGAMARIEDVGRGASVPWH
jgi:hypothetical protein